MSQHKTPLTDIEMEGLKLYGLPIGTPSQLSDSFRNGFAYAKNVNDYKAQRDELLEALKGYLANDGSAFCFDAIELSKYEKMARAAIAKCENS